MKDAIKNELNKLKPMSGRQRADYLITYYKLPFLIALICILLVAGLLYSSLSYTGEGIEIVMIDIVCEDESAAAASLDESFADYLDQNSPVPVSLDFSTSLSANLDDYTRSIMLQKIIGSVAAGEASLFISEPDTLSYLGAFYYLEDLQEVLPEDLYLALEERDMLFSCTVPANEDYGTDAVTYMCGIDISNIDLTVLADAGFILPTDIAIALPANTKNMDATLSFLHFLLGF